MPPGSPARCFSSCSATSRTKAWRCAKPTAAHSRSRATSPAWALRRAMLQADSAANRLTGIALVSLCYVLFTLLDGAAKWLVASVPVVVVVWLRFLMHALFASALLFPLRGRALVRTTHWRWHAARAVMFVLMTGLNFWALQYLQLAVTSSIFFIVPIITALVAAPMLGERIDAGRWAAIVAGFAGVLVIVRPGSAEFHPAMLLTLANSVLYAIFNLMTRHLAAYDSP